MRGKKVPLWASKELYTVGPRTGFATKIAPPTATFQEGFIPGEPAPAQYDAYWRHHVGRQVELSARTPLRNWQGVGAAGAFVLKSAAYSPVAGVTCFADAHTAFYYPDGKPDVSAFTAISTGSMLPKWVTFSPLTGNVFFAGYVASRKYVWAGTEPEAGFAEGSAFPASDTDVAYLTTDRATGISYLVTDLGGVDMALYANVSGTAWTLLGNLSFSSTTYSNYHITIHDGRILLAYFDSGGFIHTQVGTTALAGWTAGSLVVPGTYAIYETRWSDSYQAWLILTNNSIVAFVESAGPYTEFPISPILADGGALFDTGAMLIASSGAYRYIWVRDDLDSQDLAAAFKQSFGDGNSGVPFIRSDGSAFWASPGSGDWQRTLRVGQ